MLINFNLLLFVLYMRIWDKCTFSLVSYVLSVLLLACDRVRDFPWCFSMYIYLDQVGQLQMGFQGVAFLPSTLVFPPHFLTIVVEVNALGPPRVFILWLVVRKSMLPVKYACFNKTSLCQFNCLMILRLSQH